MGAESPVLIICTVMLVCPNPLLKTSEKLSNVFTSACWSLGGNWGIIASSSSFKVPGSMEGIRLILTQILEDGS